MEPKSLMTVRLEELFNKVGSRLGFNTTNPKQPKWTISAGENGNFFTLHNPEQLIYFGTFDAVYSYLQGMLRAINLMVEQPPTELVGPPLLIWSFRGIGYYHRVIAYSEKEARILLLQDAREMKDNWDWDDFKAYHKQLRDAMVNGSPLETQIIDNDIYTED